MNDFNYLPFNKNFGYKSPISDEICRTGTVKHDSISSFLNAVLYGCSIKFNILKDEEKLEKIKEFKDFIISQIKDSESFKNYLTEISDKFFEVLNKIFDFINDDCESEIEKDSFSKIKSNIKLYKIISELITIDDYVKIIKKTLRQCDDNKFETFRHNILTETIKFIDYEDILEDVDDEKVKYIKKNVCYFIDLVLDEIDIEEPTIPDVVTPQIIKLASKYFDNCDIYFIDWETKLTILIDGYKHSNNNNSIILLTFHNSHFEIIGKTVGIDSDTKKHKIKREFKPFDDIIKSINFYIDRSIN
jgi:hypothetical protein